MVNERKLGGYVQNVEFTNQFEKTDETIICATYKLISKKILIDYESFGIVLDKTSYYDCLFTQFEQVPFRNIIIMQFILYEIEHAYQNKQLSNKDDSLENKLISVSFNLYQTLMNSKFRDMLIKDNISDNQIKIYIQSAKLLYKQFYIFNSIERLAQINSYKTILETLKYIIKSIPSLYEFEEASLTEEMLNGYLEIYSFGGCPTQVYFYGINRQNVWETLPFFSTDNRRMIININTKYNLSDILKYGLPVQNEKFEPLNNWLHTRNKYNI